MLAVILANVWRGTAFSMLVYPAALSDVPPELQEAAEVDGASVWQRLRYVTLPMIRRSIVTNLMLITLQTLAVFGLIFVMTGAGRAPRARRRRCTCTSSRSSSTSSATAPRWPWYCWSSGRCSRSSTSGCIKVEDLMTGPMYPQRVDRPARRPAPSRSACRGLALGC